MSVDFNDANKAFAEKLGLTYPLLSDARRQVSREYGVLYDDPAMADDPKKIPIYLRAQRSWFVIDKQGVVRFAQINAPQDILPNDELLEVLRGLQ